MPPSATAHELFRGFSYVAPTLNSNGGNGNANNVEDQDSIATVVEVDTKRSVASRINVVSSRTHFNVMGARHSHRHLKTIRTHPKWKT